MRKKLIRVGNSLALVIDIPLREMIGFAPSREVELSLEGRRIIIEPVEEADASCCSRKATIEMIRSARADLSRLIEHYGMQDAQLQRVVTGYRRRFGFLGWLSSDLREISVAELANIRRINACVKQLDGGADWDAAIEAALRSEPVATTAA